jgi:hypothetical protein
MGREMGQTRRERIELCIGRLVLRLELDMSRMCACVYVCAAKKIRMMRRVWGYACVCRMYVCIQRDGEN